MLLVITQASGVWGHEVIDGRGIGPAFHLGTLAGSMSDVRWVATGLQQGGFYVVRRSGDTIFYALVAGSDASNPVRIVNAGYVSHPNSRSNVLLIAQNRQDQRMVIVGDRAIVFRDGGLTGVHRILGGTNWTAGTGTAADSYHPAGNQAQDKWLIPLCGDRIGIITTRGGLFVHGYDFGRDALLPPSRASAAQRIATNPQDRFVACDGSSIYVVTSAGDVFAHPVVC